MKLSQERNIRGYRTEIILPLTCKDCDYFIFNDAFSGLCALKKEIVGTDEKACDKFIPMKKCKFCKHYEPIDENLGICRKEGVKTYPDLIARTCEMYEQRPLESSKNNLSETQLIKGSKC